PSPGAAGVSDRRRASGGALGADELTVLLVRELAAVVDEEAAAAGELVGLTRQDADGQVLAGEVGAGELEALGGLDLVLVDDARALVGAPRLQLLERVLAEVLVRLARGVVVGCHVVVAPWSVGRAARYPMLGRRGLFPRGGGDCAPSGERLHTSRAAVPGALPRRRPSDAPDLRFRPPMP